MHYLFDDILKYVCKLPEFYCYSAPIPKCPKSADARCTVGYKDCQDGSSKKCIQYFDYSVNSRYFSIEVRFYDTAETRHGLVLADSAALTWLFKHNLMDKSVLIPVV